MKRGKRVTPRSGAWLGAACALLVGSAGCSDGGAIVGLGDAFDPEAAWRMVSDLAAAADDNAPAAHVGFAGEILAEANLPQTTSGPTLGERLMRAGWGSAGEGRADAPTFASVVRAPVLSFSTGLASGDAAGGRAALLPGTVLGRTFGLEGIGGYGPLPDRPGAPADGVRFLTYELDPLTGRPRTVPLNEVGHLDISEVPGGALPRLELHGVRGSGSSATTELDVYLEGSVSFTETEISTRFAAGGELLDDGRSAGFTLDERFLLTDALLEIGLDRHIEVAGLGRSVTLEWEGSATPEAGSTVTAHLTLVDGGHLLVLELVATDVAVSGSVSFDGQTAALLDGDPFDPTFSRPDGTPFSTADEDALFDLLAASEEVLVFGDEMLASLAVLFEG